MSNFKIARKFQSLILAGLAIVTFIVITFSSVHLLSAGTSAILPTLYVTNYGDNTVKAIKLTGPYVRTIATGLNGPAGLAFDVNNNLYVGNFGKNYVTGNSIVKITPTGTVSTLANSTTLGPIQGVAIDRYSNVYSANDLDGTIVRTSPTGNVSIFATVTRPQGLLFDYQGNLYVSSYTENSITKIAPNGTKSIYAVGNGINNPRDLTIDSFGNLYVGNLGDGSISKISPNGTVSTYVAPGVLGNPTGLAFDTNNNLYVANLSTNTINKISPSGVVSVFLTANDGLDAPDYLTFSVPTNSALIPSQ